MATQAQKTVHLRGRLIDYWIMIIAVIAGAGCNSNTNDSEQISELPYYNTADFTALWKKEQHFNADTIHTIAPFSFTDQNGIIVNNKMLEGKVYVVNFFFTACTGICPKMTNNMKIAADSFKNNSNVAFLSHSVTPEKDSVQILKKYAALHGIDHQQWHLLTGDPAMINNIARHSYFIEKNPGLSRDSTEFLHTENMVLIDRKGHIRGLYKGTLEVDAMRLIEDINILLKE